MIDSEELYIRPDDQDESSPPPEDDPVQDIPADVILEQLENILSSTMFDASERNRRFLRYIIEETLAGRGAWIKGYSIGISVFDRDSSFDPQIDPVVRIGAGRLRRSLERYYLTDGRRASVRVSIPKGGYVPRFALTHVAQPEHAAARAPREPAKLDYSIFVLPFVSLTANEPGQDFAAGLSEELIVEFGKHRELSVFALPSVRPPEEFEAVAASKKNAARLILGGSVRMSGMNLRVIARLVDQTDNRHVWSASFNRSLKGLGATKVEQEIGHKIANALLTRHQYASLLLDRPRLMRKAS
ncbi:MAG TPA: hypothetical protein VGH13_26155 [Xanthobacteraceae bacterium]